MDIDVALKNEITNLAPKSGTGTSSSNYQDTDLIQLYANDGTPNGKIARSALMSCIKDSLGSLLNAAGADQGTNGVKVPSINGSAALGSMTMANLASVLGEKGFAKGEIINADLNNLKSTGFYNIRPLDGGASIENCPVNQYGILMVFQAVNDDGVISYVEQIYQDVQNRVFSRVYASSWSSWLEITALSYLYNYNSLASLASALGVQFGMGQTITVNALIVEDIEASFQDAAGYHIFQGNTQDSVEAGWYGFKHGNTAVCILMSDAYGKGLLRGKRESSGNWTFTTIGC